MARTKSQQLGTASREAREAGLVIVTHPKRGFLQRVNSPAVEKARQRHARNELRKKGRR